MQEMLASLNTRNEAMQVLVQQKAGFQGAADAFRRHIQVRHSAAAHALVVRLRAAVCIVGCLVCRQLLRMGAAYSQPVAFSDSI